MNVLVLIFLLLTFLILVRSLFNLIELFLNLTWLNRNQRNKKSYKGFGDKFIICIPILREQRILPDTIKYFSKLNYPKNLYKVVFVTTSKEIKYPNHLSTFELASKLSSEVNKKHHAKLFEVLNYPKKHGVMSHQINFVIRKLVRDKENLNAVFAVYNADSRPNKNTLRHVSIELREYERKTARKANIVQQSSLFTFNLNDLPKTIEGYIMRSAGLFQTKWTLIHELSRFRKQSRKVNFISNNVLSILLNSQLSHCVGHGLFVRLDLLAKEFLPTETINEDLPFGFYQCCKREPILPFPVLENSEVPTSLSMLIRQKRVWFYPYIEYKKCKDRVLALNRYKYLFEVFWLTIQGKITGFIWLFQSLILFIPAMIAIYLNSKMLILIWTLSIFVYWFLPVAIIYFNLHKLEKLAGVIKTNTSTVDYLLTSFSGIVVLLTHSIGPVLSIFDFALSNIFDKPIVKTKTER